VIGVEHRYYGKSVPIDSKWKYLTMKQSAADLHHIRKLLADVFTGSWMTTGISKGGQASMGWKMFYPHDTDAALMIVTPVRHQQYDQRLLHWLDSVTTTGCGKQVIALRDYIFRNKTRLLPHLDSVTTARGLHFSNMTNPILFDYILLEYPFSFFQNCSDCTRLPDTLMVPVKAVFDEIIKVVPPKFYSDKMKSVLAPSFYMFYNELGYYEYDTAGVNQWLSQDHYPNNIFTPVQPPAKFDQHYLYSLNSFLKSPDANHMIFLYGELDPYSALKPDLMNSDNNHVFIVKGGCHKSRIDDLSSEQQTNLFKLLSQWLDYPVWIE
jgi:hypothetical protein